MPRPKRTKVASTTTSRVAKPLKRVATSTPEEVESAPAHKIHSSDDSDGLVTRSTRPRNQKRMPWQPRPQRGVDVTMTGALPAETPPKTEGSQSGRRKPYSVSTSSSKRTPSIVLKETSVRTQTLQEPVEPETTAEAQEQEPSFPEDDSLSLDNLLSFGSLDSDSPAHGTRPPSAIKVGATPAHESSILALKNFKRRQRQPSLLRRIHQTTDVEDNDNDVLDDLDDFNPEDQSTPLQMKANEHDSASLDSNGMHISSASSRGRKRKLSSPVVLVPRSSPYDPPSGDDVVESRRSSSPSLPEDVMESRELAQYDQAEADPDIYSETMAPPKSSSPPMEEVQDLPDTSNRRKTRKDRRTMRDSVSEDEAVESRPKRGPIGRRKAKLDSLSTARLQALLPRRRTIISEDRDMFDSDGSEMNAVPIDSDEDELSRPQPRRRATARKLMPPKPAKKGDRRKKSATASDPAKKKTYGRRASSDKENGSTIVVGGSPEDEEVTEVSATRINIPEAEIEAIASKFREVDAWELDFETVSYDASSSPW
jgi:hypothetical protein